ncbi:nitrate- and nitrite sensing domain-containing protein [Natronosporangium hydrolyticum]|uniref:histidine kinase n=1 Tax=Natronosporangium hydrolyticum TaxID=2811111 RepID=A0A895YHQ9_9ACTN|nr:nitrate- and nitrite sensing domain-containing protein [Natronosporangium hydrolyticum]QSB13268.1 nitrate- and nitrite sensing domain-containing protein [Natronosporangium hydrolyticum]
MTRTIATAAVAPHALRPRWRPRGNIATLLRLLVAVPLLAVVGFAGLTFSNSVRQVAEAGEMQQLAALSTDAGSLARTLQAERTAAAVALTSGDASAIQEFDRAARDTDDAIDAFASHGAPTDAVTGTLRQVDTGLGNLETVRGQVAASEYATLSAVSFSYRILIADLLTLREEAAAGTSSLLVDDARAAAALAASGEAIGQLQIVVLRSLAMAELTPAAQQESASARARLADASTDFLDLADPSWAAQWEQVGTDASVVTAQRLQDEVGRALPGERLRLDATEWTEATNVWMAELYTVQRAVDAEFAEQLAAARGVQLRNAAVQAAGILLVVALTAVLTSVVAQRITKRLRRLQESANTAAYERLPAVVRELSATTQPLSPNEIADRSAAELVVVGDDEIAEVGAAVRALHREAVRTAGEQAVLRGKVAEMFVHLSRREQRLVDSLLVQVDRVERDETDPDRLRELYELDHLATRMARINQSLLVLGGSGTSRVRGKAVPIVTVVQAGLSQIEQYTRVWIGSFDDGHCVAGEAVDELAHLLAELLDNATAYSSPETEVWVESQSLPDVLVLRVIDQGVGLSHQRCAQINAQLAEPGSVEIAGVRAMGLIVVGQLAARWDIQVALRPATSGGTVAEVRIPWQLISWGAPEPAAPQWGSAAPQSAAPQPAAARSEFPPPQQHAVTQPMPVATASRATHAVMPAPTAEPPQARPAPAPPPAAPLFQPASTPLAGAAPSVVAPSVAGPPTINGWFETVVEGTDAVVAWPDGGGQQWAAAMERAVAIASSGSSGSSGPAGLSGSAGSAGAPGPTGPAGSPGSPAPANGELPRRVPQQHLMPAAPTPTEGGGNRLDPSSIAAAMSAYARGVAGHRPPSSVPSTRLEQPS